jgi:hypothetical protein
MVAAAVESAVRHIDPQRLLQAENQRYPGRDVDGLPPCTGHGIHEISNHRPSPYEGAFMFHDIVSLDAFGSNTSLVRVAGKIRPSRWLARA